MPWKLFLWNLSNVCHCSCGKFRSFFFRKKNLLRLFQFLMDTKISLLFYIENKVWVWKKADKSQKEEMIKSSASRAARNMRAMASYQMRINKTAFNFAECVKWGLLMKASQAGRHSPSSIYSWSISHILEFWILLFGPFGQLRAARKKNQFD